MNKRPKATRTQELKEQARAAYEHLMADAESSYKKYVNMHQQFLSKNKAKLSGQEEDTLLRLPRRALEEVGLECVSPSSGALLYKGRSI